MNIQGFTNQQAVEVLRHTGETVHLKLVRRGFQPDEFPSIVAPPPLPPVVPAALPVALEPKQTPPPPPPRDHPMERERERPVTVIETKPAKAIGRF